MKQTAPNIWKGTAKVFDEELHIIAHMERDLIPTTDDRGILTYLVGLYSFTGKIQKMPPKLVRWLFRATSPGRIQVNFGEFTLPMIVKDWTGEVFNDGGPRSKTPPEELWLISGGAQVPDPTKEKSEVRF